MADTVLTELKIHEFDSVKQMSQYESEIGENDIVYTPDEIHEYVKRDAETGVTMVLGDADNLGARLSLTSRKSAYTDNFDGEFSLTAANDETGNTLCGKPDGTLTWSGTNMSAMCMPSGIHIDLTLGSSGATYIAPADGWVAINKVGTASGQWVSITCNKVGSQSSVQGVNGTGVCYLPVKKGDEFKVNYSLSGTTNFFRFIYAEGSKHLA